MIWYLLKIVYMLVISIIVIMTYYFWFSFHIESFTWVWYAGYFVSIIFIYFIYKSINFIVWKPKIEFSPLKIFGLFLINLFLISIIYFFSIWDKAVWNWITLFFKIFSYLILPIIITLISLWFWRFVINKIPKIENESVIFRFLISLWFWFFSFVTILTIFWFFGFYNLTSLTLILIVFSVLSYKELKNIFLWIVNYKFLIDDHNFESDNFLDKLNLKLLTTEFFFIIITFLISVNFVSIFRPMPIWWDDLWVYMNYPQMLANSWIIWNFWWIMSWQIFTWIWYMFKSATLAFYLNNVWSILSIIVLSLASFDLLNRNKKSFINIPLMLSLIYLSMPMIIFQQAKDMKLDNWLFFISTICVYILFYIMVKYIWYNDNDENQTNESLLQKISNYFTKYKHNWIHNLFEDKSYLIYILIVWVLAGFAFSIKLTSLLLISAIIWVLFYSKLWIAWLFGYFSIFVWIFTKLWLWSMMNVIVPKDDINFVKSTFYYSFLLGFILFVYSLNKYWKSAFIWLLKILTVFLAWVIIALSPWILKNTLSIDKISIWWILSGKAETFKVDYSKIYTNEEIKEIEKNQISSAVNSSWVTTNEDFWRYFGYEKWLNNYVKLPYNLTMQKNQRWEFTDITFIYLALILTTILFLNFRSKCLNIWAFWLSILSFLVMFSWTFTVIFSWMTNSKWFEENSVVYKNLILSFNDLFWYIDKNLTTLLWSIEIPFWYLILALIFIIPFLYFNYSLKKDKLSQMFKIASVFWLFYIFLWSISAFWIVWYWITMYFILLFMIAIWVYYISDYEEDDDETYVLTKMLWSISVLFVVLVYVFNSTIPHWFNNIKASGFNNFKAWYTKPYTTIFDAQPEYLDILLSLNIKEDKKSDLFNLLLKDLGNNSNLVVLIKENKISDLKALDNVLKEINNLELKNDWNDLKLISIKAEALNMRENLYKNILYPTKDFKNQKWIYRIWTFLMYFISENYNRVYEDSLVQNFWKYFYSEKSTDITIERMKKMWLNYLLSDLNAATIDRDPRHDLTTRFENLLKSFTSDKLELIKTDSICLRVALEDYKKSKKTDDDMNNYITLASVNHESYTSDWKTIQRWEKQIWCYNHILTLFKENKVDEKNYNYLLWIKNYIDSNKFETEDQLFNFLNTNIWHGWLVLFKIKD